MGEFDAPVRPKTPRYLSRTEVAQYLGLASVKSLSRLSLPAPDVIVGEHKGWTKETIDRWNKDRPGPGWWGARNGTMRSGAVGSARGS